MNNNIIYVKRGDILKSKMQTIVNPVNCKGVMGAGLAKKFKENFPKMYNDYVAQCKNEILKIGKPILWKNPNIHGKWILNFPTKDNWRNPSQISWIEMGLKEIKKNYKAWRIKSIAFPALGCNLGGLSWIEVKPLMEKYLSSIDIPVELYIPKMEKMETILEIFMENFKKQFEKEIRKIAIISPLFPDYCGITDWKKRDSIDILIAITKKIDDDFWKQVKKNIPNRKKVEIIHALKNTAFEKNSYIYNVNFQIKTFARQKA